MTNDEERNTTCNIPTGYLQHTNRLPATYLRVTNNLILWRDKSMIDALKSDEVVKKVGGQFRLTALVQRRLKELIEGARPLVEVEGKTLVEITIEEILRDKITIDYERTKMLEPPDIAALETEIHQESEADD